MMKSMTEPANNIVNLKFNNFREELKLLIVNANEQIRRILHEELWETFGPLLKLVEA